MRIFLAADETGRGTLKNNGADIAPYHDTDSQIPIWLKGENEQLKMNLITGKVLTGWAKCS